MHNIYTTEGFVLKSVVKGEADKFYTILTKDFGLIRAEAQGVRKLYSKLRYSLQDFSLVELSLVRGREKWRIVSARVIKNIFVELREKVAIYKVLARIILLVSRLIHGEEKNEILFEHVKTGALFLSEVKPEGALLENTEYVLVLRILHSLGYLGNTPNWDMFTRTPLFESDLIIKMEESKREAVKVINESLKESHL